MIYNIITTNAFKKNYKRVIKRGYNISLLKEVIEILANGELLSSIYHNHSLNGNFCGYNECRIKPDWLLIYYYNYKTNDLVLCNTGTHADLLNM